MNNTSTKITSQIFGTKNLDACPLWTALITPFFENSQIDFPSLKSIALAQAEAGNGLLLLGSTGEGLS
jgi:4-hydroxy-tetrahydrodipicolinate synthase